MRRNSLLTLASCLLLLICFTVACNAQDGSATTRLNGTTPGDANAGDAISPLTWARVIRQLPHSEAEIIAAHEAAAPHSCLEVPPGQPLESKPDNPLVPLAGKLAQPLQWNQCRRLGMLTLGCEMTDADQAGLPRLSGRMIRDRVLGNYISLQVGAVRDENGTPYLIDRGLAAVGDYAQEDATLSFAEIAQASIQQLRSLGLYVPADEPLVPENMRTLVMLYRSTFSKVNDAGEEHLAPVYEWFIVRARENKESPDDPLVIHTFATSESRTVLHYFREYDHPEKLEHCGIRSMIFFTRFGGFAGLKPAERATRGIQVQAKVSCPMTEVNQYVAGLGLKGDAFDHLPVVLDAMIDGKLRCSKSDTVEK